MGLKPKGHDSRLPMFRSITPGHKAVAVPGVLFGCPGRLSFADAKGSVRVRERIPAARVRRVP